MARPRQPRHQQSAPPQRSAGRHPAATEKDYQRTIIDAAKCSFAGPHRAAWTGRGWRTPIQGHAGFPDLVLVHAAVGVLFVELKYSTKLTADQQRWGDVLTAAGADWRELRVPDGLDVFCQYLADAPRAGVS